MKRLRRAFIPLLVATLLGCGVSTEEHQRIVDANLQLRARVVDLEEKSGKLAKELDDLKKTDQGLWQTAKQQESTKAWRDLESTLDELLSRWPKSPLAPNAGSLRRTARQNVAERIYADMQASIEQEKADLARTTANELISSYSETSYAQRAKAELSQLERKIQLAAEARAKQAREEARQRERASSDVELTAFSWHQQSGYAIVEGQVRNLSQRPLKNVQAVAIFTSSQGDFVTSDSALIEYNPILPGQSSPFQVMARWNPAMKSSRIEFKQLMGGELSTVHSWKK